MCPQRPLHSTPSSPRPPASNALTTWCCGSHAHGFLTPLLAPVISPAWNAFQWERKSHFLQAHSWSSIKTWAKLRLPWEIY